MKMAKTYQGNLTVIQTLFNDLCKKHNVKMKFKVIAESRHDGCGTIYIHPVTNHNDETPSFSTLGSYTEACSCLGVKHGTDINHLKDLGIQYDTPESGTEDVIKDEKDLVKYMKVFDVMKNNNGDKLNIGKKYRAVLFDCGEIVPDNDTTLEILDIKLPYVNVKDSHDDSEYELYQDKDGDFVTPNGCVIQLREEIEE